MQYCGKFTCNVFAFIDVLQFKEVIACKNIDYVQRILLSRYFKDFLTFEGVAFVVNCTFCTFVPEDTNFYMSYKVSKTMKDQQKISSLISSNYQ